MESRQPTNFEMVAELYQHAGIEPHSVGPVALSSRARLERGRMMHEEIAEFFVAHTLEDQADALIDLVVFALGTAHLMQIPWDLLFTEVHRANMDKEPAATDRSPNDLVKPDGWVPPQLRPILERAAKKAKDFQERGGNV